MSTLQNGGVRKAEEEVKRGVKRGNRKRVPSIQIPDSVEKGSPFAMRLSLNPKPIPEPANLPNGPCYCSGG
jgi:hypothetical protein